MKTNDYIKYVTQQFVSYVDQPRDEKIAKRKERKNSKIPKSQSMFGLIPFAISQSVSKWKKSYK
ncbi:YqzE family protein [Evansella sp. AB-rgal1]|uniref:YqzE family protein n=1 Tax=Evansella sp. AB-rgal1 TaxID=3242696 RepID=UPI00359EF6D5